MTHDPRVDAKHKWSVYGRHGLVLYGAPGFTGWSNDRAFALLTGEPNLDLNICSLLPGATAADAQALLAVIDRVGAPTVVPTSTRAQSEAVDVLLEAGFQALEPEVAMWRPPEPPVGAPGPFDVREHAARPISRR